MLGYYLPDEEDDEDEECVAKKPVPCKECEGHGILLYCDCARGKTCGNYREETCYRCKGKGTI